MGTPLPRESRKPSGELYHSGTEWEFEDAFFVDMDTDNLRAGMRRVRGGPQEFDRDLPSVAAAVRMDSAGRRRRRPGPCRRPPGIACPVRSSPRMSCGAGSRRGP
jgi:hypothetical protein